MDWKAFIERVRPMYFSIIYKIVKNYETTEDIIQDVYLSLLENEDKYTEHEIVGARIAFNKAISHVRRNNIKRAALKSPFWEEQISYNTCYQGYEDTQYYESILKEIGNDRSVQMLKCFITGYTYKEICAKFNAPMGTVKSAIHLARKRAIEAKYIL